MIARLAAGTARRWALVAVATLCFGCSTNIPNIATDATPDKATRDAMEKNIQETLVVPTAELKKDAPTPEVKEASPGDNAPTMQNAESCFSEYKIGPNDVLSFRSFDDESLSGQYVVRFDGFVSFPLTQDIKMSGLTRQQALDEVKKAYGALFQEPQVSLAITQTNSKTFAVMGEVSMPGEYPYLRPMSLIDSINAAGGMRVNQRGGDSFVGAQGQLVKAIIIRHDGEKREILERDMRKFAQEGPHAADTLVMPGDIIYVPEGVNLVYILGEVRSPGVLALSESSTLLQVLTRAGGFVESSARLQQVVLTREESEKDSKIMFINVRQIMKTGKDIKLAPGDIIYVPRKPMIHIQEFVQRFTGTVSPVLSLYRQAWDTYYAKKQWDNIFDDSSSSSSDLLSIEQSLRNITSFSSLLAK